MDVDTVALFEKKLSWITKSWSVVSHNLDHITSAEHEI